MDIDFIVQDTFALTRPQWKLASNFDDAWGAFADALKQNVKAQEPEKVPEAEVPEEDGLSDDEGDEEELPIPEADDTPSSSDEAEVDTQNIVRWCHVS